MFQFFLILMPSIASAFWNPLYFHCRSEMQFTVQHGKKTKNYSSGDYQLPFHDLEVITIFSSNKKKIAKIYPRSGIDSIVFNKTYKTSSDSRHFWKLTDFSGKTQMHCETRDE